MILYRRKPIKVYQNKEFATELLPHGPNEDPDCYNSLRREISSTRAKNVIGKDYLKSCLILDSRLSQKGVPDLLVGRQGVTYLMEVKERKGELTDDQEIFFENWQGQAAIVRTVEGALEVVGL
jgi:hypothetical protein